MKFQPSQPTIEAAEEHSSYGRRIAQTAAALTMAVTMNGLAVNAFADDDPATNTAEVPVATSTEVPTPTTTPAPVETPTPTPPVSAAPAPKPTAPVYTNPVTRNEKARYMDVQAHRGVTGKYGKGYAEQNTVNSAKKAIASGANTIELDMRETSDHQCVVNHYADTRKARKHVKIATHSLAQITSLPLKHKGAGNVNSCASFLGALSPYRNRIHLEAEIKDVNSSALYLSRVALLFRQNGFSGANGNARFESFHVGALQAMHSFEPSTPLDLNSYSAVSPGTLLHDGLQGTNMPYATLSKTLRGNPSYAQAFANNGLRINAWDVDTTGQMQYIVDHSTMTRNPQTGAVNNQVGLSAFISDHPGRYASVRR